MRKRCDVASRPHAELTLTHLCMTAAYVFSEDSGPALVIEPV